MIDKQLSFLSTEPSAFDVNAVDHGVIHDGHSYKGSAALCLAQRHVDDCVFGLGFTNWKVVIDHALSSNHYELCEVDGRLGLRKHGFRYAPIPTLPSGGAAYVQQRLLAIASERKASPGRHEKMVVLTPDFAHKIVVEASACDLTIKQNGSVIRACILVDHVSFSDTSISDPEPVSIQLEQVLLDAGASTSDSLRSGCKAMANQILRMAHGVR